MGEEIPAPVPLERSQRSHPRRFQALAVCWVQGCSSRGTTLCAEGQSCEIPCWEHPALPRLLPWVRKALLALARCSSVFQEMLLEFQRGFGPWTLREREQPPAVPTSPALSPLRASSVPWRLCRVSGLLCRGVEQPMEFLGF